MIRAGAELRIEFSPGRVELVQTSPPPPCPLLLVTGATGLLGRAVCKTFRAAGWSVTGTAFSRAKPRLLRCDITDAQAVRDMLQTHRPDVVIHCAAERRPDVVEKHTEAAVNLNVHATGTLARETACIGALFLYISTDYVFDGRNPPYGENDSPNPLNVYGRTKMEGERETLRNCPGAIILRVPVLYGEVENVSESAVTILWRKLQKQEPDSLDDVQQRFPTNTKDVAAVCLKLVQRARQDPSARGIFHFSAKEQMTKYRMALKIAEAFNLPTDQIVPLSAMDLSVSQRPLNAQLDCSRLDVMNLNVEPQPFHLSVREALWPFTEDKQWRQTVFH